jgi:hypothetical protein
VTGSVGTKFDDYWVRYSKVSPTDDYATHGVWREIPQPGLDKVIDPSLMPHALIGRSHSPRLTPWSRRYFDTAAIWSRTGIP